MYGLSLITFWTLVGIAIHNAFWTVLIVRVLRKRHRVKVIADEELPKAAILLCLRGADPTLRTCLRRLLRQDYPDYELFVCVDFMIEGDSTETLNVTLTNSTTAPPDSLIDAFGINMNAANLGTDFSTQNFDPSTWDVLDASGGVRFDYVGETSNSGGPGGPGGDRLANGENLTFDIVFATAFFDSFLDFDELVDA